MPSRHARCVSWCGCAVAGSRLGFVCLSLHLTSQDQLLVCCAWHVAVAYVALHQPSRLVQVGTMQMNYKTIRVQGRHACMCAVAGTMLGLGVLVGPLSTHMCHVASHQPPVAGTRLWLGLAWLCLPCPRNQQHRVVGGPAQAARSFKRTRVHL
jgi:hypothetical protein